jgi:predicted TIM-barrel fold metal-dependent hydrolase
MRVRREIPSFLQPLHTDEFSPLPASEETTAAIERTRALGADAARRVGEDTYWLDRQGTAAGLIAVNEQHGAEFYVVPPEAVDDSEAADEALGGDEVVIDVQTHYIADRLGPATARNTIEIYRNAMPSWWKGLDDLTSFNFAEYLRCIFLETENAVAVLSSAPGVGEHRQLYNDEMLATRVLLDELGARGRLLNHAVVDPTRLEDLSLMDQWADECGPVAWKVYTLGEVNTDPSAYTPELTWREKMPGIWTSGWMLDDDDRGSQFLQRVEELAARGGPRIICAHKGLSGLIDTGSPRDIGPAAAAHPDLQFIVYHSGYEISVDEEGPYTEATADVGTNRMVTTLRDHRIAPGSNVYAELGSTWFVASSRPREAAHILGKMLLAVGEDNVLWGTDSIWYGPPQSLIDSFRAFQIPLEMQEEFGYPAITDEVKAKILSLNAARLYGIDLDRARSVAENDDLVWMRGALDYYREKGSPR